MVKPYWEARTSESQFGTVARFCKKCRTPYEFSMHLAREGVGRKSGSHKDNRFLALQAARGEARYSAQRAYERARAKVSSASGKLTYGVLCPKCRKYETKALQYHFPRGLRSGIRTKLIWRTTFRWLLVGLVIASLTIPLGVAFSAFSVLDTEGTLFLLLLLAAPFAFWGLEMFFILFAMLRLNLLEKHEMFALRDCAYFESGGGFDRKFVSRVRVALLSTSSSLNKKLKVWSKKGPTVPRSKSWNFESFHFHMN